MLSSKPFKNESHLFSSARKAWNQCEEGDYMEAFSHHPKIGDIDSLKEKYANTKTWASNEQSGVETADMATLEALQIENENYEKKYGFIFIVCATGKSAKEMLGLLKSRLKNPRGEEILIAAEEQAKITEIRLKKLLA